MDDTAGTITNDAAALNALALLLQPQDAYSSNLLNGASGTMAVSGTMMAMDDSVPNPGDGANTNSGSDSSLPGLSYVFDTNGLWLQITNVFDSVAYLNLYNAADQVYVIWGTTNLLTPLASWSVQTEVWPTNSAVMPFTTPASDPNNLFFIAEDWTGVTENGNTAPDWWFWMYFGTTALYDTNLDNQGNNTLLYDYTNGLDPNVINFSVEGTNNYVSSGSVGIQLNVMAGTPSYQAVLVDDTNFADASWTSFGSTNLTVNLGTTEGWHAVWVGLRGLPSNAQQSWAVISLKLETTPPSIVITNPSTPTVSVSTIQLEGYSPEGLAHISCDVSNAAGVITNLDTGISDRYYDSTVGDFTTNYFECLDVPVTNGVNAIVVHATDLAGNTSTTTNNFTVDYSTKTAPVVQLTWPQDGMTLCETQFDVCGQVDDPTVTIMASITDTNGCETTLTGVVERNGRFWLEGLPLNSGLNALSITASNVVGQTTVTNLSLSQGGFTATMYSLADDSQLWQSTVNVGGTISDPTYAVWVNGTAGANNGDGTWSADNVPVTQGGVAIFDITAYPASEAPSGSSSGTGVNPQTPDAQNTSANISKPVRLYVESYSDDETSEVVYSQTNCDQYGNPQVGFGGYIWWVDDDTEHYSVDWEDGASGSGTNHSHIVWTSNVTNTMSDFDSDILSWPAGYWPNIPTGTDDSYTDGTEYVGSPVIWEHCALGVPVVDNSDAGGPILPAGDSQPTYWKAKWAVTGNRHAQADIKLQTGGKAASGHQGLFLSNRFRN